MDSTDAQAHAIARAAASIAEADALVIGAGAGMGVDSGLPDFRGNQGFWQAYPRYAALGLSFAALANPRWFDTDPELAWGFYGHRLDLYRTTLPHFGFGLLLDWSRRMPGGAFVFTSNVDGQFQAAGFSEERVLEIHGSIHFMQCLADCGIGLISANGIDVKIDAATARARMPLPSCPRCKGLLRPNILMFGDGGWSSVRSDAQHQRLDGWLRRFARQGSRLAIVECGAGVAIPSVRYFCAELAQRAGAPLIRINPREPDADFSGYSHIAITMGAREALTAIAARL